MSWLARGLAAAGGAAGAGAALSLPMSALLLVEVPDTADQLCITSARAGRGRGAADAGDVAVTVVNFYSREARDRAAAKLAAILASGEEGRVRRVREL